MSLQTRVLQSGLLEITQEYKPGIHNGIDVVNQNYTLGYIVAHSSGIVVACRNNCNGFENGSYGNYVKIKHDNGYYTLYAHMAYNTVQVSVGQRVSKGQTLGYMGNTGMSYGGHLHFEVRNSSDVRIDPTPYLNNELPLNSGTTGVITYQAYVGRWLPEVNKCDDTNDGYAGNNTPISAFRCKPQYGEITYQAKISGGDWLPPVSSNNYSNGSGDSYAGIFNKPIDLVKIKSTVGWVKYQVKTKEDGWLPIVDSRTETGSESYAGVHNHEIIGIRMY